MELALKKLLAILIIEIKAEDDIQIKGFKVFKSLI